MKKIFNFIIIFYAATCFGQSYQGKIEKVSENSLYQIKLTPEVISASKNNLDFLRIFDSKNNEVPYVLFAGKSSDLKLVSLPIISKNITGNDTTSIIISNEKQINLDHLTLKIANTAVDKKYSISGSNDKNEWFGLVLNQTVTDLNEGRKTAVSRDFSFPLNNYKFLKFDFVDKNSLPINILEAYAQEKFSINNEKTELLGFREKITTDKETKQTKITITFDEPQLIEKLSFDISSPGYFLRDSRITVNKTRKRHKRTENFDEETAAFQLNSKTKNIFEIPEFFTDKFTIIIDNNDNMPLEVNKIRFFQSSQKILADLKKNESYTLKIDSKYTKPSYDLAESGIDFNQNYPAANLNKLQKTEDTSGKNKAESFWQTPYFMWICIILAVIFIGYFAVGLLKDVNKEN
ncbi:hypothetical protein ASG01_10635 [Chryseobacterium sp. Leaf180]|uniref:hypothetical protein n=1 Tax=Chryseobacterium sp. Leaf180 TaxID=1736289 RepID=UPI00070174FA|nr:hypothetical protein [Chryseobacterium sp. Leaf180]KQR93613.1 hypothetical protein ASG01_10635 [Chryseobacterium sp. Leaf180]